MNVLKWLCVDIPAGRFNVDIIVVLVFSSIIFCCEKQLIDLAI